MLRYLLMRNCRITLRGRRDQENTVYGVTIQSAAFNLNHALMGTDQNIAEKRSRSMTPPKEIHYDASKEVCSKA